MPDSLYPLRFAPIFKPAIWGGHSLRPMLGAEPSTIATGEAWLLSDQGDNSSRVADGRLAGRTLRDLMRSHRGELIGNASPSEDRFPLLLKFLDARQPLSVQVHPNDEQARTMSPGSADLGKTEAWVILKAQSDSRLFAGLRTGVGRDALQSALTRNDLVEVLHSYVPDEGDCIFLNAGTVHAIGAGLILFEIQQTSDITYRLDDWGRVDAQTGQPRELHVTEALKCISYESGPCDPVQSRRIDENGRERLVSSAYFTLERMRSDRPFAIGRRGTFRIIVCIEGRANLLHRNQNYPLSLGSTYLLPASIGESECIPEGSATILESGCQDRMMG